jgi:Tfp pilus assembly protein PilV
LSILEVLVAGVILTIAGLGTALMYSKGYGLVTSEGDARVALSLAQQRIEQIRAGGFNSVPANPTDSSATPVEILEQPVCNGANPCEHPGYQRSTSVVCVSPTNFMQRVDCASLAAANAKLISVRVEPFPTESMATPVTLQAVLVSR